MVLTCYLTNSAYVAENIPFKDTPSYGSYTFSTTNLISHQTFVRDNDKLGLYLKIFVK